MNNFVHFMAATTEDGNSGMFGALGIDWKILVLQAIAFGILVFILAKWVYPPILAMLDRREKLIEDSVKSAKDSAKKSAEAEQQIAKDIEAARNEASDIIASAREQAGRVIMDSEKEAGVRADNIVASAREQLTRDVKTAQKALRDQTVSLVATAAEKVVDAKIDLARDKALIESAIKESEQKLMREYDLGTE
jgi:F-type H+-transporting ATPase subunit b